MKTLISTDTSCLIDNESIKKYEISLFPLNVIIDGEEFLDGVTISQEELKVAMGSGKKIQTSTPPIGSVIEYFENLFSKGYDHIIHFTRSSKLSSMNELFTKIANENFAGKVTIIDAYGLSACMLSYVFYAYEEVKKGTQIQDIIEGVESLKLKSKVVFIPENLTALKNGGRISPTVATIGNILGIKPLISLTDGELKKETMVRRVKKTFFEKIDQFLVEYPVCDYDYTFVNFDADQNTLECILNYASLKLGEGNFVTGNVPVNVCAHCGPGTIGLLVSQKINGKSLSDFN